MHTPKPERQIDYIELPMTDLAATRAFYETVLGWRFEDYGPDYTSFFDGRLAGGFTKDAQQSRVGILVVIYTTDLAKLQKEIKDGGGRIVKDTFSFPGGHRFHFTDPNGNELAAWSDV